MGRHRAPDDDEPSDDYPEPEQFEDGGGYREPPAPRADEPRYPGSFPAPRYPSRPPEDFSDDFHDGPGFFDFDVPEDDRGEELPRGGDDPSDDFPDFPRRDQDPPTPPAPPPSGPPTGGHRGLPGFSGGHRNEGGRRGVSIGVIAALISVIVVVGVVILWRFFGDALSNRSHSARCVGEKLPVAVIADPSISDQVQRFADRFNGQSAPVGDHCVAIGVKSAGSDAVVDGFIGNWPGDLGQRPALWIPGSSVSAARLTASAGKETVSDSRSLVTSPVVYFIEALASIRMWHCELVSARYCQPLIGSWGTGAPLTCTLMELAMGGRVRGKTRFKVLSACAMRIRVCSKLASQMLPMMPPVLVATSA